MPSDALPAFRAAVAALWKPDELAVSVFAESEQSGSCEIVQLEDVIDPAKLPAYWTLSVPSWYQRAMGSIECPKAPNEPGIRKLVQTVWNGQAEVEMDVYPTDSPFLVFEVDYLFFEKNGTITPEQKTLQREAMAYAFQASGFPCAVLVDSGGKSIHATVRLDDDSEVVGAWRNSQEFDRLQDLATVVFGDYDQGVLKQSGRARLVRTPGASRSEGVEQRILAVGQRTTTTQLTQWFLDQLSPEAQREVLGRQPITARQSTMRQHYLRLPKWRGDLLRPHTPGERGTHWFHVSKSLMMAGCREPRMIARPAPAAPYGQWSAAWLWHVSAFTFDRYSNGWFFSHTPEDWSNPVERVRWDVESSRRQYVNEQLRFEGATDPTKNALVDQMMAQAAAQAQALVSGVSDAALPPPPNAGPPMHIGGTVGATVVESADAAKKQIRELKKKIPKQEQESEFAWVMPKLREIIPQNHLIKLSMNNGGAWYGFDGRIWKQMSNDFAKAVIARALGITDHKADFVNNCYQVVERTIVVDEAWIEYGNAIAFLNGTLYVDNGTFEFHPEHEPDDRLRSMVPCAYDPHAVCPRWVDFVRWALPESSRASLLQEAFGYTLLPGQLFQSFFMMTGQGNNGKSVVLSVLQAIHRDSTETVALSKLGSRFALGSIGKKRLALDAEAEHVTNTVQGDGNSSLAILKAWTGGDFVPIEAKGVQGWSETINAKYFMSCNKRPRFADPTKGVWRRLKLMKFESSVDKRQEDVHLPKKLALELPGIVNWALSGLVRLFAQNGFTQSQILASDLSEYQIDSDSVATFVQEFMRPALNGSAQAWFDIRPVHKAYRERCSESGNVPVSEPEFRQRLELLSVPVGRPQEHEIVNGCPMGTQRGSGPQHWSIKGWRCLSPFYTTQTLETMHSASNVIPMPVPGRMM